jgi:putative transposase
LIFYKRVFPLATVCGVPKLFRTQSMPGIIFRDMKLTKTKIHWIIRQNRKGVATKDIARHMLVSTRRVQQILKEYRETGKEPSVGENLGRPAKPYDEYEAQIVKKAHERYRFGARMLEQVIRKQYKIRISHNRIHMYLKAQGLAQENQKKQKRRKWVRYEREHSLSAGHIDWHEVDGTGIKVCVVLDDASRMVLAGGEFSAINTENSKLVIDQLVEKYWWLCPMRELILDHGSEFGAHRIHDDGSWKSDFKSHLEKYGIRPILARVKHPQTNGKLERFFGEYKKHRAVFSSFDEFICWYNNRPHGSLNIQCLETPEMAFRRKMPPEAYFAIGHRLFGL